MAPEDTRKVTEISPDSPVIQSISTSVVLIGAIVGGIAIIAIIGYTTVMNSYEAKLQDRKDNALLYDDPNEKNLFSNDLNELPPVNIGGNAQQGNKQQSQLQMANNQQVLGQQAARQQNMAQQQPPESVPEKKTSPSPTPTPKDTFINEKKTFSVSNKGWTKDQNKTTGENSITTFKSPDSTYTLTISEVTNFNNETKKKYETLEEYVNSNPGGRKPANGTEPITLSGKEGVKSKPFVLNSNGSSVKTTGAYLFSENSEFIYSLELDSTNLDINNSDSDAVFKDITTSFNLIK